jgi:FtsZ-interacting cell division protein ZipA
MNTSTAVVIAIVALLLVGLVAWMYARRRSRHLREHFGPEYDRMVRETNSRRRAESELVHREKRVEKLPIRPIPVVERSRYVELWQAQQARFVDDPKAAVADADRLVEEVMRARGYPVGDFEQKAADISVDHPQVVENYRAGHDISLRLQRGRVNTEDLRNAMIHYRALFQELLEDNPSGLEARA